MPRRISRGVIFADAAAVIAFNMLLTLLGVGIGAATIDPVAGDTPSATGGLLNVAGCNRTITTVNAATGCCR